MGHRANFIVVDGDGWQLHYSHWAANGIYRWLAAGPDAALAFVLAQRRLEPRDGWLDDLWCEGGAVIDRMTRRLLWYGNDWMIELPIRRAFLRLLARTWPGWRVDWAYDGIGDLAAHVGVDRAVVRNIDMDEPLAAPRVAYKLEELILPDEAALPVNRQEPYQLLTVRSADGLAAWVLDHERSVAWLGPGLLDQLPGPGFGRLRLGGLPETGVHIDVSERRVGVWTGYICPGLLGELDARWAGWGVTFWEDRFERQMAAAQRAVELPVCDERAALDQLARNLSAASWQRPSPMAGFAEMIDREREAGKRVEVNPAAWEHTEAQPAEHHQVALDRALAEVAAELSRPDASESGASQLGSGS